MGQGSYGDKIRSSYPQRYPRKLRNNRNFPADNGLRCFSTEAARTTQLNETCQCCAAANFSDVHVSHGIVRVALDVPLYRCFDYLAPAMTGPRSVSRARPFGRRQVIGLVVDLPAESDLSAAQLKAVEEILPAPVLPADWFRLTGFCASYYQHPLGEVMLSAPPAGLKRLDPPTPRPAENGEAMPPPSPEPGIDRRAGGGDRCVRAAGVGFKPFLLFGVTGSGKTEVICA